MSLPDLATETKGYIHTIAHNVWCKYGKAVPVCVDDIIAGEKLPLVYDNYEDAFEAALNYNNNGHFQILVNKAKARKCPQRQRFTLAHELGHFFIAHHSEAVAKGKIPCAIGATERLGEMLAENEAHLFASCLLLPSEALSAALRNVEIRLCSIIDIAAMFDVSVQCAASRCVQQAGVPCAVIMMPSNSKRPPWIALSDAFKEYGVTRNSKIARKINFQESFCEPRLVSDWFENISSERSGEMLLETSMRLGLQGNLVFLRSKACQDWGQPSV